MRGKVSTGHIHPGTIEESRGLLREMMRSSLDASHAALSGFLLSSAVGRGHPESEGKPIIIGEKRC